jgi:8-oxo-dGTP diphosphatase
VSAAYAGVADAPVTAKAADDAAEVGWYGLEALPELAFDHADILQQAEAWLKAQAA